MIQQIISPQIPRKPAVHLLSLNRFAVIEPIGNPPLEARLACIRKQKKLLRIPQQPLGENASGLKIKETQS